LKAVIGLPIFPSIRSWLSNGERAKLNASMAERVEVLYGKAQVQQALTIMRGLKNYDSSSVGYELSCKKLFYHYSLALYQGAIHLQVLLRPFIDNLDEKAYYFETHEPLSSAPEPLASAFTEAMQSSLLSRAVHATTIPFTGHIPRPLKVAKPLALSQLHKVKSNLTRTAGQVLDEEIKDQLDPLNPANLRSQADARKAIDLSLQLESINNSTLEEQEQKLIAERSNGTASSKRAKIEGNIQVESSVQAKKFNLGESQRELEEFDEYLKRYKARRTKY
jgi:hypothetical protein